MSRFFMVHCVYPLWRSRSQCYCAAGRITRVVYAGK